VTSEIHKQYGLYVTVKLAEGTDESKARELLQNFAFPINLVSS